jgi:NAD-dependent SIR2 family protein deacetylase
MSMALEEKRERILDFVSFLIERYRPYFIRNRVLDREISHLRIRLNRGMISERDIGRLAKIVSFLDERGADVPSPIKEEVKHLVSEFGVERYFSTLGKAMLERTKGAKEKGKKLNIVFMFGSGASHPPPSNIPTVSEMLGYLVERLPPTEIPFASKVKDWAIKEGVNVEDILTAGYLSTFLVSKPVVNKLVGEIIYRESEESVPILRERELREREYVISFQDLVNRVFSMVSGMMATADSNVVHESVAELIKRLEKDELLNFAIVTTNYDVCLEKAFVKHSLSYSYLGIGEGEGTPFVKMHGSINWFYCEGCQSVITYSIKELEAFKKIFPTSGSCQKCGTPTSLLMVPPIAYKYVMFPPLIDLWQAAMRTIEKADVIVVIGYSFSLGDDYIFKMIVSSMKKNNAMLIMANKDFDSITSLETKLSAYHLKLLYPICGDATETVPRILRIVDDARTKSVEAKPTETVEVTTQTQSD